MDKKHGEKPVDEIVFIMMETLKSNGTFDDFRRHCISDIDTKPAYQNWKQRIESNVNKYLSHVSWTPELNVNALRERLRKHLHDGRETHDIEEGADRILNQVLSPRTLNMFENKIKLAVDEFLGITNDTPSTEINGLKDSSINLQNVSDVEINTVSNSTKDLIMDTENVDEVSPEFEPITSVLHNENSNDESISGISDLVSVGSPLELVSNENCNTNSNGFETDRNSIEEPQKTVFDKNGIVDHINNSVNIKHNEVVNISNSAVKCKTNDSKSKSKHHSSRTSRHTSSQEKSSTHRSKDYNSSIHRSTSRENDPKKKNNHDSEDRKSSSHNKHYSESKDKKHKHNKKSHHDRDKTLKRDRKDSRTDKKEKSSSVCKEPKSLNGNRSDDESNAGGSSRQKNSILKNKSSTSDKSKASSSSHKNSRKDNGSKDVVDKPKDKSISINSDSSNAKNNQTDKLKPEWNNFLSSFITNDEKDAANVLLSMSEITYKNPHNEVKEKNIVVKNSANEVLNIENKLIIQKNSNETKILQSNDIINIEDNLNLVPMNLDMPQSLDYINSIYENNISNSINVEIACEKNVSNSLNNVCEYNISNSVEVDNICENNKSNSVDVEIACKNNISNSIDFENIYENDSNSGDVDNVCKNNVSNSINIENSCKNNVSTSVTLKSVCENTTNFIDVEIACENNISQSVDENVYKNNISNSIDIENTCKNNILTSVELESICENISHSVPIDNVNEKTVSTSVKLENVYDKVLNSVDIDNVSENIVSNSDDVKSVYENNLLMCVKDENVGKSIVSNSIDVNKCTLLPKDIKCINNSIENAEEIRENYKLVDKNDKETIDSKVNLNLSCIPMTNENFKTPELNLLRNINLANKQNKRKKHCIKKESKVKKLKLSKSNDISDEINVPITDTMSSIVICKHDNISNCNTDIQINDSVKTFSNQALFKDVNTIASNNDKSSCTFKGFSQTDAVPCKNYNLMVNLCENLKTVNCSDENDEFKYIENDEFKDSENNESEDTENYEFKDTENDEFINIENNEFKDIKNDELKDSKNDKLKNIENDEFKGFENDNDVHLLIQQKLIIIKEFAGFKGFSEDDIIRINYEYNHAKQQLELAKKKHNTNKKKKNITNGKNGIQNGKKCNPITSMIYKNNEKNDKTPDEIYNQPNYDKKECPTVNNNNHDITASDNWVVEQEMKYKLLPVKVKLERMIGINQMYEQSKDDSPEVPSAPKRSKFK